MAVNRDTSKGTWTIYVRYTDWQGKTKILHKRGFKTRREALEYERAFLLKKSKDLNMGFSQFVESYLEDLKPRLKYNTYLTKEHIIRTKILPYFEDKALADISTSDIMQWQNEILQMRDDSGKGYSPTYLKTISAQMSALFNHATRYYDLKNNPCQKVGNMGKKKAKEMLFWTRDEFLQFIEAMKSKPISYYAFEILFWTGIREGDADGKISLNQQKPSKHAGLRRFGPEKFLQRNNEFMKERPIFYKKPIKTEKDFSTWLRCFYYTTKAVITEYIYF